MASKQNLVKVTIYGKEYTVKGKADRKYIESVANYVDAKMKEVDANVPFESSLRVSILAAMNVTDELFTQKKELEQMQLEFDERARSLTELLDETLLSIQDQE